MEYGEHSSLQGSPSNLIITSTLDLASNACIAIREPGKIIPLGFLPRINAGAAISKSRSRMKTSKN
jgi:hypothetical protein